MISARTISRLVVVALLLDITCIRGTVQAQSNCDARTLVLRGDAAARAGNTNGAVALYQQAISVAGSCAKSAGYYSAGPYLDSTEGHLGLLSLDYAAGDLDSANSQLMAASSNLLAACMQLSDYQRVRAHNDSARVMQWSRYINKNNDYSSMLFSGCQ